MVSKESIERFPEDVGRMAIVRGVCAICLREMKFKVYAKDENNAWAYVYNDQDCDTLMGVCSKCAIEYVNRRSKNNDKCRM